MIYIGLGANLPGPQGGPETTLVAALRAMPAHGITLERFSPFYLSAPVPASSQPWFVNAVAAVATDLAPRDLLAQLLEIEKQFGRARGEKNASRTLDLDLLDYHGQVIEEPDLVLPHPRLHERAFVLFPLHDLAPEWTHPVFRKKIKHFLARAAQDQVVEPLVD